MNEKELIKRQLDEMSIVFNNRFNEEPIKGLTTREHSLLLGLMGKLKKKGNSVVYLSYNEVNDMLSDYKYRAPSKTHDDILQLWEKIKQVDYNIYDENNAVVGSVLLFTYLVSDVESQQVKVKITPDLMYFVNDFTEGNYSSFAFRDIQDIKQIQAQHLYKQLAQYSSTGFRVMYKSDLVNLLDVPPSFQGSRFKSQVLDKAIKELQPYFPNLKVKSLKKGRTVDRYEFTFTPQKNVKEWDENKYKKKASPRKQSKVKEVNPKHANPNFHSEKAEFEEQHAEEIAKLYE